jgi:hypothetical protein
MALEDAVNPIKGASGPGKYAKRLDRMPANFYGDQKQTAEIASGAPISKSPDVRPAPASDVREAASTKAAQMAAPTPLYAPTERPMEPITHGIDMGPGAGSEALMLTQGAASGKLSDTLAKLLPYDTTGEIGVLYQQAQSRGL